MVAVNRSNCNLSDYFWQMKYYSGVTYKYESIYKVKGRYFWDGGNNKGYATITGAKIAIGMRVFIL